MKLYALLILNFLFITTSVLAQTKVDTLDINLEENRIYAIISADYFNKAINDTTGTSDELYYDFSYYAQELREEEPELTKFFIVNNLFVDDKPLKVDDVIYVLVKDGEYEKHRYIVSYNALDYYMKRMGKQ